MSRIDAQNGLDSIVNSCVSSSLSYFSINKFKVQLQYNYTISNYNII